MTEVSGEWEGVLKHIRGLLNAPNTLEIWHSPREVCHSSDVGTGRGDHSAHCSVEGVRNFSGFLVVSVCQ